MLATRNVTKLYHSCDGESYNFFERQTQNLIYIGWERLFEDNPKHNLSVNSNAVTCMEVDEEFVFIVDEEVLTLMDSIVEEHE